MAYVSKSVTFSIIRIAHARAHTHGRVNYRHERVVRLMTIAASSIFNTSGGVSTVDTRGRRVVPNSRRRSPLLMVACTRYLTWSAVWQRIGNLWRDKITRVNFAVCRHVQYRRLSIHFPASARPCRNTFCSPSAICNVVSCRPLCSSKLPFICYNSTTVPRVLSSEYFSFF